MADERRDGLDQLTDAARAASKVAKIVQAAQAGGAAGAAAQTVKEYHRQAAVVIAAVLLLPVLLILCLPGVIFGSLMSPSGAVLTDELEIAENVIEIKNSVAGVLQTAYEAVLDDIEQDSIGRYSVTVTDEIGGQVSFNALEILSLYCAHMGATDYAAISIDDLVRQVKAHKDEYYAYTAKTEVKIDVVDKVVDGVLTRVPETHDYGGAPLIATQDISDFFALEGGKYGRGILNNCKIKIILNLEEDEAQLVQKVLKLTDSEIDLITRFERGNALISTNSNHVTVSVRCSEMEQELITTDREELRRIVERELNKKEPHQEDTL